MHTLSPPKPRTTAIQTAVQPTIIALSAGDAAALYKEAQTNLFIRDERPLPTVLPQEIFQTTLIRTCEKYDRGTDWAMNALLHTVQTILHIVASRFPDGEPNAQIIEETLSNSEKFPPLPPYEAHGKFMHGYLYESTGVRLKQRRHYQSGYCSRSQAQRHTGNNPTLQKRRDLRGGRLERLYF